MAVDILIVDDEADIRDLVAGILEDEGFETRTAHDSDSALSAIEQRLPSLLVLDIWLQGSKLDGLEVLEWVRQRHRDLPVIVISGHANVETAVAAIKKGAYDFIEKPFKADHLILTVERATQAERLRLENIDLRKKAGLVDEVIGRSQSINVVRQTIERVAGTNSRIMIFGPPGSGKEVVARIIHRQSPRAQGAFVVMSAATMEAEQIDHELFGIEQNGGVIKTGLFEKAHGGTLYIDELADLPLSTQAKVLRILTERVFERVGGSTAVKVDVRVISTSGRDLVVEMREGRFREDIYHRLNVVPITMPALSERREDIPPLIQSFATNSALANGLQYRAFDEEAVAALQAYNWPGNIRQLKNTIERVIIMASGSEQGTIGVKDLPDEIMGEGPDMLHSGSEVSYMTTPLRQARESFEREYLRLQINRFSGNISKTAAFIGMERSALHRKLKTLGLTGDERSD